MPVGFPYPATFPPNTFNYSPQNLKKWRAALAKVKAGTSNARILCPGDSTTQGIGSNGSATGNLAPLSYPAQLAGLFTGAGINAHWNAFAGNSNAGQPRNSLDSRIAFANGWAAFTSPEATYATIGGFLSGASASTEKMSFTPTVNVDTFKIWYFQQASAGTVTFDINGSGSTSFPMTGSSAIGSTTFSGSLGANTLNITWASGGFVFIVAIEAWDSSKKWVSVMNAGWSASASTDWVIGSGVYSPANINGLSPDLTLINLGINDWNKATALATYTANIQTLITNGLLTGDVILITPNPSQPSVTYNSSTTASIAVQQTYVAAMYALAQANGIILIDNYARANSYATMNALSMDYDALHPNGAGYADEVESIFNVIGRI